MAASDVDASASDDDGAEPPDEPAATPADESADVDDTDSQPAGDDNDDAPEADPPPDDTTEEPVIAGPDPADYASQGTALVALEDGRSFEGSVGCETSTNGNEWVYRFGGVTDAGVQLEGAYDTSQPDFVIVFVSGPDSLSGDGVLLSNINGGDDLVETNDSGTEWTAAMTLWSPEGDAFSAQITAVCS